MAIEIKELVVKSTVQGNSQKQAYVSQEQLKQLKLEIYNECIGYLKTQLKEQKER